MAKDVDLSSSEWIDIIFEGKQRDFGACEPEKPPAAPQTALLAILILLVAVPDLFAKHCAQKAEERPGKTRLSRP